MPGVIKKGCVWAPHLWKAARRPPGLLSGSVGDSGGTRYVSPLPLVSHLQREGRGGGVLRALEGGPRLALCFRFSVEREFNQ